MTYDEGNVAHITVEFAANGQAVDPTTVALKVKAPDGTVTPLAVTAGEIVKDSVGHYHYDQPLATAGEWWYRWEGTGANQAAVEAFLSVRPSEFSTT